MKVNYTFQQIIIYHCMQRFTTTQDDSAIRQSWLNYNQVQLQFILTISSYKSNSPLFQSHYKQIIRQKHSRSQQLPLFCYIHPRNLMARQGLYMGLALAIMIAMWACSLAQPNCPPAILSLQPRLAYVTSNSSTPPPTMLFPACQYGPVTGPVSVHIPERCSPSAVQH